MKIRILGFEWDVSEGLPLSDFYNTLVGASAEHQATLTRMLTEGVESVPEAARPQKIICIDRVGALWRGVFIKLRSTRSFVTLVRTNNVLTLTAEELEHNKAMAEVNFFVINEVTGRGLYQHYHQSTHLDTFCAFCKMHYDNAVVARRSLLQQSLAEKRLSTEEWTRAKAQLAQSLSYAVMVRKEQLPALIQELEQINSIDVVFAHKKTVDEKYRPIAEFAMRESVRFVFGRQSGPRRERIKQAVVAAAEVFSGERKARIAGMLPGKISRVFDLEENYDVLGELDYDKTAKDLKVDLSDLKSTLEKSTFMKHLTELANRPNVKARLEAPRE